MISNHKVHKLLQLLVPSNIKIHYFLKDNSSLINLNNELIENINSLSATKVLLQPHSLDWFKQNFHNQLNTTIQSLHSKTFIYQNTAYNNSYFDTMTSHIVNKSQEISSDSTIIPLSLNWYKLYHTINNPNLLYMDDNVHFSSKGAFFSGLILYTHIFPELSKPNYDKSFKIRWNISQFEFDFLLRNIYL